MGDAAHCEGHDYHSIIVHFSMSHSDNPYFGRRYVLEIQDLVNFAHSMSLLNLTSSAHGKI